MNEVFLINIAYANSRWWSCHEHTESLAKASDIAQELRNEGFRVNVQSILIDEDGRVKV